ncbi:MAG: hypothetical protein Ct9H300mP26_4910 [Acidimicrobiales bacterium]|nr:MAG: hypothetical protein Ct9H300mP26_4910 [Acidimicrobiales bacterium]
MADLGADVIKLEPPQGDLLRGLVTVPDGPDPWWELDNRGKRGIVVDLTTEEGIQVAHKNFCVMRCFRDQPDHRTSIQVQIKSSGLRQDHPQLIHLTLRGMATAVR